MNSLQRKIKKYSRAVAFALTVLTVIVILAGITSPAQAQTYPVAFPAPTTFDLHPVPSYGITGVAVGDFNGDGKLDVLGVSEFQYINVALGNGDGTFQAPITTTEVITNTFFYACAAGDFNGDGLLDVAIWATDSTGITKVVVLFGNGAGSFTYSNTYIAPNSNNFSPGPSSIVAVDVNGDGKTDLVALSPYNGVYIFLNEGNGTFGTPENYPLSTVS